jgi:hypothetical protein
VAPFLLWLPSVLPQLLLLILILHLLRYILQLIIMMIIIEEAEEVEELVVEVVEADPRDSVPTELATDPTFGSHFIFNIHTNN